MQLRQHFLSFKYKIYTASTSAEIHRQLQFKIKVIVKRCVY